MAERLQPAQPGSLPAIKNFRNFVNAAPSGEGTLNPIKFWAIRLHDFFSQNDIIAKEFPEYDLNTLYEFWHSYQKTENHVARLNSSSHIPLLPELESKEARKIADRKTLLTTSASESIIEFTQQKNPDWSLAETAIEAINLYKEEADACSEEQIIALNEAIGIAFAKKPLDPLVMRQLIAQHAFTELCEEGAPYAAYYLNTPYEDPTSMQDPLELEKAELIAALGNDVWNKTILGQKEKSFKQLLAGLKSQGYRADDDVMIGLKLMWDYAIGKIPKKTSAIKILRIQQEVFQALQNDEVFDIDLGDEETEE